MKPSLILTFLSSINLPVKVISSQQKLTTTLQDDVGQSGIMFNLVSQKEMTVHQFEIHTRLNSLLSSVKVYTKDETFVGYERNPQVWTNVLDAPDIVTGQGLGVMTTLPVLNPLVPLTPSIPQSFYVTLNLCDICEDLRMTRVALNSGLIVVENANLHLSAGRIVRYSFGRKGSGSVLFNGSIIYAISNNNNEDIASLSSQPALSPSIAVSSPSTKDILTSNYKSNSGQGGIAFDVKAITNLTINGFNIHTSLEISVPVELYMKKGTSKNFENKPQVWALVKMMSVLGKGSEKVTSLPSLDDSAISMLADDRVGIYLTLNVCEKCEDLLFRTGDGKKAGSVYISNDHMKLFVGNGVSYKFRKIKQKDAGFSGSIRYNYTSSTINPIAPPPLATPSVPSNPTIPATPSIAFSFFATGDAPYHAAGKSHLDQAISSLPGNAGDFIVHLGDIKRGQQSCEEFRWVEVRDIMKKSPVPAFLTPGDNEWSDCPNLNEAMALWNKHFVGLHLDWSSGLNVITQSTRPENFSFVHKNVLFIAINYIAGSSSDKATRLQDNLNWFQQQFNEHKSKVKALVMFGHKEPSEDTFFKPVVKEVADHANIPSLYMHGNIHKWKYSNNIFGEKVWTAISVDSGNFATPVKVTVDPSADEIFSFDRRK